MKNLHKIMFFLLLIPMMSFANEAADKALLDAIEAPSLEGVKKAFADGASGEAKDKYQRTPFSKALNIYSNLRIRVQSEPEKKKEYEQYKAIVYEIFNHMTTLTPDDFIRMITAGGLRDLVEKMLAKGMAVDARGKSGRTALMELVMGYPDLDDVKFLVAKGADVNAVDKQTMREGLSIERSVLDYALSPGTLEQFKAADYLIDKGAKLTSQNFVRAVARGRDSDLALVKKIHQKVGMIDAVDALGWTALRNVFIFGGGNKEIVNYLLDQNANVNAMAPGDPESLLFVAIRYYYYWPNSPIDLAVIENLLKHGAKIDEATWEFMRGDFPEVVRLLGPSGAVYKDYQQPDPAKKEQVLQLLKKYKK